MSQTKDFTAVVQNGIAGYFIQVKGEVNCGKLEVMPTLTKAVPQGINPKILLLDVYPAIDDEFGKFQPVEYKDDIESADVYEEVNLLDPDGELVERIIVQPAHDKQPATN